jgi:ascorbate-specific PTS system EIIC-type component UlaA
MALSVPLSRFTLRVGGGSAFYVRQHTHAMKITITRIAGWLLISIGVLVVVFSQRIVFPGLERLIGIETIVGKENVVYQPDGGYYYTNPGAMILWIISVAAIGIFICLSGSLLLFLASRTAHKVLDEIVHDHAA